MRFLNTILNIIFPIRCVFCGKNNSDLCQNCLSEATGAERESENWIFPIYDYRNPIIKKSLSLLKYKGKKRLAKIFAGIVYEKILEELSELSTMENFRGPILIPIPLSPKRYRERGYNQAELICRELIKIDKLRNHLTPSPSPNLGEGGRRSGEVLVFHKTFTLENNILIKIKETEHQARIKDRRIRLKNLSNSFAIKNGERGEVMLKGKNIILIDDITTTGATLSEAKKILKQAGARKVIAFTVAH
ncbi:MAG: phosphoribosyltransferase family protein [bacterium]